MATTLDKAKAVLQGPVDPTKIPPGLEERIKRGRDRMREGAPKRNECLAFSRGEQFKFIDTKNALRSQSTTSSYEGGGGKPRHRLRRVRNFIFDIVETEVAASTQRVPAYDVSPSGTEARRISAARLARKVALYGYDAWRVRQATERVVRYAVVADEGFAWPYFDNTVGPFFLDENENPVGQGEICIRTFGPNEVFWEPGVPFNDSNWHGIIQARDIESVLATEGCIVSKLDADGQSAETSDENPQGKLVLVTEYLERPSAKNPEGRWITMANGKIIVPARPYPCVDGEGKVLNEPVLHKLAYAMDPDSDRDSGLVRHLIDPQRAINHCSNKFHEWINLALNPQFIIQNGRLKGKRTDEPGAVYTAVGSGEIKVIQPGQVPPELMTAKQEAISDMARIAAQNTIPSQVESGRGIQALLEKDSARRANFLGNLSEFHSRLMRHCLYLVQKHYTEPRLLKVRGEQGIEPIRDFEGSELLSEVDVRVDPGSLEPRTRENVEAKILAFADRGWVSPHAAMAAINSGTAEALVDSYERAIARANLIIQKVKSGPEVLFQTPPRRPFATEEPGLEESENPETGEVEQVQREFIPGWMPRPFDNIRVQRDVFEDWMQSVDYDDLDAPSQEAANTYYSALLQIEAKKNAEAAAAQAETAESLGMSNAAKPQGTKPLPDQAPLNKEQS